MPVYTQAYFAFSMSNKEKKLRNILTKSGMTVVFLFGAGIVVAVDVEGGLLGGITGTFGPNGTEKSGSSSGFRERPSVAV
jgi:hypothetical protein